MRQIKFRGLKVDGSGWEFGVPYFLNIKEDEPEDCINKACIITGVDYDGTCGFMSPENRAFIEVIPESIGELLLTTNEGLEVYEHDLVIVSQKTGGVLPPGKPIKGVVELNPLYGVVAKYYKKEWESFSRVLLNGKIIEVVGHSFEK